MWSSMSEMHNQNNCSVSQTVWLNSAITQRYPPVTYVLPNARIKECWLFYSNIVQWEYFITAIYHLFLNYIFCISEVVYRKHFVAPSIMLEAKKKKQKTEVASLPRPTVHSHWLCAVPPLCLISPGSYSARACWKVKRMVVLCPLCLLIQSKREFGTFLCVILWETHLDMYCPLHDQAFKSLVEVERFLRPWDMQWQ